MIIRLEFEVTKGWAIPKGTRGQRVTVPVDSELLSTLAQRVAQGIRTTDNSNPLSQVRLRSHLSLGSLMDLNRQARAMSWTSNITIPDAVDTLFPGMVDQPEIFVWRWGKLAVGESPEAFMNRNAKAMAEFGSIVYLAVDHFTSQGVKCAWGSKSSVHVAVRSPLQS